MKQPVFPEIAELRQLLLRRSTKKKWRKSISQCHENDSITNQHLGDILECLGIEVNPVRLHRIWTEFSQYQNWVQCKKQRELDSLKLNLVVEALEVRQNIQVSKSTFSLQPSESHQYSIDSRTYPLLAKSLRRLLLSSTRTKLKDMYSSKSTGKQRGSRRNFVPAFLFFSEGMDSITFKGLKRACSKLGTGSSGNGIPISFIKKLHLEMQNYSDKGSVSYNEFVRWIQGTHSSFAVNSNENVQGFKKYLILQTGVFLFQRRMEMESDIAANGHPVKGSTQVETELLANGTGVEEEAQFSKKRFLESDDETNSNWSTVSNDVSNLSSDRCSISTWSNTPTSIHNKADDQQSQLVDDKPWTSWHHSTAAIYAKANQGAGSSVLPSNHPSQTLASTQAKGKRVLQELNSKGASRSFNTCKTPSHKMRGTGRSVPKQAQVGWSWKRAKNVLREQFDTFRREHHQLLPMRAFSHLVVQLGIRLSQHGLDMLRHDLFQNRDSVSFSDFYRWLTDNVNVAENLDINKEISCSEGFENHLQNCRLVVASRRSASMTSRRVLLQLIPKVLRRRLRKLRHHKGTLKELMHEYINESKNSKTIPSSTTPSNFCFTKQRMASFMRRKLELGDDLWASEGKMNELLWDLIIQNSDVEASSVVRLHISDVYSYFVQCYSSSSCSDSSPSSAASDWSVDSGDGKIQLSEKHDSKAKTAAEAEYYSSPLRARSELKPTARLKKAPMQKVERIRGIQYYVDRSQLPPKVYNVQHVKVGTNNEKPSDNQQKSVEPKQFISKGSFVGKLRQQHVITGQGSKLLDVVDFYAIDSEGSDYSVQSHTDSEVDLEARNNVEASSAVLAENNEVLHHIVPVSISTGSQGLLSQKEEYYLVVENKNGTRERLTPSIGPTASLRETKLTNPASKQSTGAAAIQFLMPEKVQAALNKGEKVLGSNSRKAATARRRYGWVDVKLDIEDGKSIHFALFRVRSRIMGGDQVIARAKFPYDNVDEERKQIITRQTVFLQPIRNPSWRPAFPPLKFHFLLGFP